MAKSTVIPNPSSQLGRLISAAARGRCECCGGPTLPVIEQRGAIMLCNRCARFCEEKGGKFRHVLPARIDRPAVDRLWAIDLGFKKLAG